MRWRGRRQSANIEDRRGTRVARAGIGGGIGIIALILLGLVFGVDPRLLLEQLAGTRSPVPDPSTSAMSGPDDEGRAFVGVVLADTEDVWNALFREHSGDYQQPTLVLFSGAVQSACGFAQAAMGPFYCPPDQKVYIDLSFYDDLRQRFGAPGDFAQAYVIAHEVGHHVQNLLGTSEQVAALQRQASETAANRLSVRQELQADCYAGVWAHHAQRTKQILESGDIEEALGAASAIGDDRLQRQSRGYVTPETFTHGSAAQRVRWFRQGLESGSLTGCDTFAADAL
jgi:predicted metalloprotease